MIRMRADSYTTHDESPTFRLTKVSKHKPAVSISSKTILARILSKENIRIVHGEYRTAFCNVKNGVIYFPSWADRNQDVYDMFLAHEISHVMHTPAEGWHDAIAEEGLSKSVLNILEDIRIERLIQEKYAGLRRNFTRGYKNLVDRGFFGENVVERATGVDAGNALNLIDRINIDSKIGSLVEVLFDDSERDYLRRSYETETWDDVVELAREISSKIKRDMIILGQSGMIESGDGEDSDGDEVEGMLIEGKMEELGKGDGGDGDPGTGGGETGKTENDGKDGSAGRSASNSPNAVDYSDIVASTDNHFRMNEERLYESRSKMKSVITYNAPGQHSIERRVIRLRDWVPQMRSGKAGNESGIVASNYQRSSDYYRSFIIRNRPVINHMIREFEMRRAAVNAARTQMAKTGKLDMLKMHSYRFNDDIFRRMTIDPRQQNHGIMILVDMSGSMGDVIGDVIDQVVILTEFCDRQKVEYRVYAFTNNNISTGYRRKRGRGFVDNEIDTDDMILFEMIRSGMSRRDKEMIFQHLIMNFRINGFSHMHVTHSDYGYALSGLGMGGTPLTESLLAVDRMMYGFREEHSLDNVSFVCLTDGCGFDVSAHRDRSIPDRVIVRSGDVSEVRINVGHRIIRIPNTDARAMAKSVVEHIRRSHSCTAIHMNIVDQLNSVVIGIGDPSDTSVSQRSRGDAGELWKSLMRSGSAEIAGRGGWDRVVFLSKSHLSGRCAERRNMHTIFKKIAHTIAI